MYTDDHAGLCHDWLSISVSLWFGAIGPPNREAGVFVALWVLSILATGIDVQRIFCVGLGTFALLVSGVIFTFMEFRRLERLYPDG